VTTAEYFAPDYLGMFRNQYPGITVRLHVANRSGVLSRIEENRDDLYFLNHLPEDPTEIPLEAVPFLKDELVVIAPPDHPLAHKQQITLEQLSQENILTREEKAGTRRSLTRRLRDRGIALAPAMELGSNEAIKHGIMGGLGIGVLAHIACRSELDAGELIVLDVEGFPIDHPWYVVYPQGKQPTVVASAFLDFIQSLDMPRGHISRIRRAGESPQ
jgi:DNA-binding transcriptional LysR family regulator